MWLCHLKGIDLNELKWGQYLFSDRFFQTEYDLSHCQSLACAGHATNIHASSRLVFQVSLDKIIDVRELLFPTRQAIRCVGDVELHTCLLII